MTYYGIDKMQGLRKTNIGSRPGLSALWCERKGYPAEENVGGRRIGSDSFPFSVNYVSQWGAICEAFCPLHPAT